MRTTLSPASTASFMMRTMCSLPGNGRWRNGGGAPLAASRTSHWFQPAKTNFFPPRRELVAGGADEVVAAVARRRGRLVAHGLTEVERVVRAAVVDRAEPVRVVVEEGAARVVLDIVPTQGRLVRERGAARERRDERRERERERPPCVARRHEVECVRVRAYCARGRPTGRHDVSTVVGFSEEVQGTNPRNFDEKSDVFIDQLCLSCTSPRVLPRSTPASPPPPSPSHPRRPCPRAGNPHPRRTRTSRRRRC